MYIFQLSMFPELVGHKLATQEDFFKQLFQTEAEYKAWKLQGLH
jgi:hypothetical protein